MLFPKGGLIQMGQFTLIPRLLQSTESDLLYARQCSRYWGYGSKQKGVRVCEFTEFAFGIRRRREMDNGKKIQCSGKVICATRTRQSTGTARSGEVQLGEGAWPGRALVLMSY